MSCPPSEFEGGGLDWMALRCRSGRESKSPDAGLFRVKQSGEIAARRKNWRLFGGAGTFLYSAG